MNCRSDCVLIQQASGSYKPFLELTVARHLAYCMMHNIDYWPIFGEARSVDSPHLPHFDRVTLIQMALEAGYDKVVWMDADCVIIREEDFRAAVPEYGIGISWNAGDWIEPLYDHWCTGCMYLKNSEPVREFVRCWQASQAETHGWQDQHAFNNLSQAWVGRICFDIPRRWHTILPSYPCPENETPNVIAFHGYGDLQKRYDTMQALFTHSQYLYRPSTEVMNLEAAKVGLVSILSLRVLDFLVECLQMSLDIEGDVIECGVYRGGTSAVMMQVTAESGKHHVLCDTFAGMPEHGERDTWHGGGFLADTSVEAVRAGLEKLGHADRATLVQGLFADTLPNLEERKYCFAHVDGDYYESTKQALEHIWPRMSEGGWVVFDDYHTDLFPGVSEAVQGILGRLPDASCEVMAAFQK